MFLHSFKGKEITFGVLFFQQDEYLGREIEICTFLWQAYYIATQVHSLIKLHTLKENEVNPCPRIVYMSVFACEYRVFYVFNKCSVWNQSLNIK